MIIGMDIDIDLTNRLLAVTRSLEKTSDIIFSQFRITLTGYEILKLIDTGTETTTALSKSMYCTLSSITHKTKVLEKEGFVQRASDQHDRRIWRFSVTDKGKTTLGLIGSLYQEALKRLYSGSSHSQKQQVSEFLEKIENHLQHALGEHRSELTEFVKNWSQKHHIEI